MFIGTKSDIHVKQSHAGSIEEPPDIENVYDELVCLKSKLLVLSIKQFSLKI